MQRGCAKGCHASDVASRETTDTFQRITLRVFTAPDASDAGTKPYSGGVLQNDRHILEPRRFPKSFFSFYVAVLQTCLSPKCFMKIVWPGQESYKFHVLPFDEHAAATPAVCNEIQPSKQGLGIFRRLRPRWIVNTRSPRIVNGET